MREGRLINNNDDTPAMMSIDQFIDTFNRQLSSDSLRSFYGAEISSRTELFGKITHRFSTYEAAFHLDGAEQSLIGINSIQMITTNQSWIVTSLAWNDQIEHRTIPRKYL